MFRYIGDLADRFSGGLIGATLGVIFAMSAKEHADIAAATGFLLTFFVLFCIHSLPRYFARQTNGNGIRHAILVFLRFLLGWLIATVYFCNFYVFREGWSQKDIDVRLFLVLLTLLIASIVSIVSVTAEGIE
jgi:FtsH-binding integral membrane protein